MFAVTITEKGGQKTVRSFSKQEITIGRIQGNDIMLPKSNISKRHARIVANGDGTFVVADAKSTNGTYVNGRRIQETHELQPADKIYLGDFVLEVAAEKSHSGAKPPPAPRDAEVDSNVVEVAENGDLLPDDQWEGRESNEWQDNWSGAKDSPEQARTNGEADVGLSPVMTQAEARVAKFENDGEDIQDALEPEVLGHVPKESSRRAVQAEIKDEAASFDATGNKKGTVKPLRHTQNVVKAPGLPSERVLQKIEMGPLQTLLDDHKNSVIVVQGKEQVFVRRHQGRFDSAKKVFRDEKTYTQWLEMIMDHAQSLGNTTGFDGVIQGSHRLTVVLPPASASASIVVRRLSREIVTVDDLVVRGVLSANMAEFLEAAVRCRQSVLVVGPKGAGKTFILNLLATFIPPHERIVCVEAVEELPLEHKNVVRLSNSSASDQVIPSISTLAADRLVIDPLDNHVLPLLQAIHGAHAGALVSVFGQNAMDGCRRVDVMAEWALQSPVPLRVTPHVFGVVVAVQNFADDTPRITTIAEPDLEAGERVLQDIFTFDLERSSADGRVVGHFHASGTVPRFYKDHEHNDSKLSTHIFSDA